MLETARVLDDFLWVIATFNQRALAEMARNNVYRPLCLFRRDRDNRALVAKIGRLCQGLNHCEWGMLCHLRGQRTAFFGSGWQ